MKNHIDEYINFIKEAELLKSVLRTAWTASGRRESTAEHSWRLALFVGVVMEDVSGIDREKALMMSLIHDIGELYSGDVSAALKPDKDKKQAVEEEAFRRALALLPVGLAGKLFEIWAEYEEGRTAEARLVKALDKAETIIQHNQGKNPADFDYEFNLGYGKHYFEGDELLGEIRARIDTDTKKNISSRE